MVALPGLCRNVHSMLTLSGRACAGKPRLVSGWRRRNSVQEGARARMERATWVARCANSANARGSEVAPGLVRLRP